jgi:hypothetical protein
MKRGFYLLVMIFLFSCTKKREIQMVVVVDKKAIEDKVNIEQIIMQRASSAFGIEKDDITGIKTDGNVVNIRVNTEDHPDVIEELSAVFNSSGRGVEFWQTYNGGEIYTDALTELNDTLKLLFPPARKETDKERSELEHRLDSIESQETVTGKFTGPLFDLLRGFKDPVNEYSSGALLGNIAVADTAALSGYFAIGLQKAILPEDLCIAYMRVPRNAGQLDVYALKGGRKKQPFLSGDVIKKAEVVQDKYSGAPVIEIDFAYSAVKLWEKMTRMAAPQNGQKGKAVAIVVDGELLSCPVVQSEIKGGRTQISSAMSVKECNAIRRKLLSGYFPYKCVLLECSYVKE